MRTGVGGFHRPRVFWPVVAATAAIAVLGVTFADPAAPTTTVLVLAVVILVGIPHGAVDHLVAVPATPPLGTGVRRRRLGFEARYVAAMAAFGVVWFVAPPIALAGFLVASAYHFGQSDLAHLRLPAGRQAAVQWSRGLFLVGLPLIAHLPDVDPLIAALGGGEPTTWSWVAEHRATWSVALVGQHVLVGALVARRVADRMLVRHEVVGVAVLTLLFVLTHPLVGFAVYFGLWHSLAHLLVLSDVLAPAGGGAPVGARRLARLAAPRTAVSLAGLATLVALAASADRPDLVLPAVLVVVSLLTLPHLVVVEGLWRRSPPSWAGADRPADHGVRSPSVAAGDPVRTTIGRR